MHPRNQPFSLMERVGVLDFCYSHEVPMKFSLYIPMKFSIDSQHVPQVPKSSSLYPISFALSFTLETLQNPKEKNTTNIFWDFLKAQFFFLKNLLWANQRCPQHKEKIELQWSSQLKYRKSQYTTNIRYLKKIMVSKSKFNVQ